MSYDHDSENVNRLWSDRPQPSGDANIISCLWCFTLLMNFHDFVAEPVNTVHSFHDAHTVPFCLTADHISTCLMMSSARFKPAQLWSVLIRGEWKCSICSYQRRLVWRTVTENWCGQSVWWKRGSFRGVPWRALWWKRGSFHGVPWTAHFWMRGLVECLDSWPRMQWYAPSHSVSTAGNGCSGRHRLSQCLDSWYWNALDSRSGEVSVLISGRLRRMVSEVLGKHFGVVYSWSTMSSSFVSCLA